MGNRPHSRIQNLYDLRYYLSKLIGKVEREEISVEKAKALGYLARCLMDVLQREQDQKALEQVERLEEAVGISHED